MSKEHNQFADQNTLRRLRLLNRRLKLTASAFNGLRIRTLAVMVAGPTVMQNSQHPLLSYSTTARHLLDLMLQGKITETEAPTIREDATRSGLSAPHLHPLTFYAECPFCRQHSQFTLVWDRHRIMLACIPGGLDWFSDHCQTSTNIYSRYICHHSILLYLYVYELCKQ